jgi:hypothetical protein
VRRMGLSALGPSIVPPARLTLAAVGPPLRPAGAPRASFPAPVLAPPTPSPALAPFDRLARAPLLACSLSLVLPAPAAFPLPPCHGVSDYYGVRNTACPITTG